MDVIALVLDADGGILGYRSIVTAAIEVGNTASVNLQIGFGYFRLLEANLTLSCFLGGNNGSMVISVIDVMGDPAIAVWYLLVVEVAITAAKQLDRKSVV